MRSTFAAQPLGRSPTGGHGGTKVLQSGQAEQKTPAQTVLAKEEIKCTAGAVTVFRLKEQETIEQEAKDFKWSPSLFECKDIKTVL